MARIALFFAVFLDFLTTSFAIPLACLIVSDLHAAQIGLMGSREERMLFLGLLLFCFPLAQLCAEVLKTRMAPKNRLLGMLFCMHIGFLLIGMALWMGMPLLLLAGRFCSGLGGGALASLQDQLVQVSVPQERVRNFGLFGMSGAVGFVAGPLVLIVGNQLEAPFASAPFAIAVLLALCALLLSITLPERSSECATASVSILVPLRNPQLKRLLLPFTLYFISWSLCFQFLPLFMLEQFAASPDGLAGFFAYTCGFLALFQMVGGGFIPSTMRQWVVAGLAHVMLAGAMVGCLVSGSWIELWLIIPLYSIAVAFMQGKSREIVANQLDSRDGNMALNWLQSVQAVAMLLPPLIGGVAAAVHPMGPLVVAAAVALGGAVAFGVSLILKRSQPLAQKD